MVSTAICESNGGTRSCSLASSSATSGGIRSLLGRQHPTKLHKNGAKLFQSLTQAYATRLVEFAPKGQHAAQTTQSRMRDPGEHQLIEPITEHPPRDGPASQKRLMAV